MANYLMVPLSGPEIPVMCQALNPEAEEKHYGREEGKQPFSKWHFVTQWQTNKVTANDHVKTNMEINKICCLGFQVQLGNFSKEQKQNSTALCTADKKALKSYR